MATAVSYRAAPSGIMRDITKKLEKKRDPDAELKAIGWMSEVIGEEPPAQTYDEALRNGAYLCQLMNAIQPNSIKKIRKKANGQAFTVMQNIDEFNRALLDYGLKQEDLFQTNDLWEKRNLPAVTKTIYALARTAKQKGWNGPELALEHPRLKDF